MICCYLNKESVYVFLSFGHLPVNRGIFDKRCTNGLKWKDAVVGPWSWLKQSFFQQFFEVLKRIIHLCKHNISATTSTICCFIFPLNSLAKLAYFFHWKWLMTVDLSVKEFKFASRCSHKSQCTPRIWCSLVCRINFSSLDAFYRRHFGSSLYALPRVLFSNYPRFFCV
jgi:hypothetical protein